MKFAVNTVDEWCFQPIKPRCRSLEGMMTEKDRITELEKEVEKYRELYFSMYSEMLDRAHEAWLLTQFAGTPSLIATNNANFAVSRSSLS